MTTMDETFRRTLNYAKRAMRGEEGGQRMKLKEAYRLLFDAGAAAERKEAAALLDKCRQVAEWHVGDSDECGTLAREVLAGIDAVVGEGVPS